MSLCQRDCKKCNMQMYCQGCSLCEKPFCEKQCRRCFSLCPDRPAAFAHLKQIGGGKITLQENDIKKLPVFIPVIPDHLPVRTELGDVIGIHGGNLLTSNGENVARVYKQKGLQEALNLSKPVEGVLQFYVKDRAIEGLWDNRREIYKQLAEFPWKAIIAPNFSVYEDAPRMDHLYNMKRSNLVFHELLEAGLPAVPDISWYNRIDLDQWIRTISESGVKTIAFSFQTVSTASKAANIWRHYLMGFHYLMQNISSDVSIIVAGLASPKRLEVLRTAGNRENRICVLNQTAYMQSRRGVLAEDPSGDSVMLTKEQILQRNINFYQGAYRTIGLEGGTGNAKIKEGQPSKHID